MSRVELKNTRILLNALKKQDKFMKKLGFNNKHLELYLSDINNIKKK
jgi:hypothetical protein